MFSYLTKLYQLGALPVIQPGVTTKVAIGSASIASPVIGAGLVRIVSTVDCHVVFGTNPTADTTCLFLPASMPEYFACATTDQVGVIQDSAAGNLYITPAV
jgi:hypothetical protein